MMEQEIIHRQKATIEALGARIAHMERTQTVTDASIRKLISQCTDYQNQVRELTKKVRRDSESGRVINRQIRAIGE